jgi:hypothetical protein
VHTSHPYNASQFVPFSQRRITNAHHPYFQVDARSMTFGCHKGLTDNLLSGFSQKAIPQALVLSTKEPFAETVFHRCDAQARQRAEIRLANRRSTRLPTLGHPDTRMTTGSSGSRFWPTSGLPTTFQ